MFNVEKYRKQVLIYILLLMILLISTAVILINKYSFAELPLSIAIIYIVNLLFFYLIYKNIRQLATKASVIMQNQDSEEKDDLNKQNISTQLETKEEKQFHKNLLTGITKKTSKKNISEKLLNNLVKDQQADIGLFYSYNKKSKTYQVTASYAYITEDKPPEFKLGEGLNGQVVKNRKAMIVSEIPDNYLTIVSGLGKGKPKYLFIYPIILNNEVFGVIELASLSKFEKNFEEELTKFFETNHDKFLNIEDN